MEKLQTDYEAELIFMRRDLADCRFDIRELEKQAATITDDINRLKKQQYEDKRNG